MLSTLCVWMTDLRSKVYDDNTGDVDFDEDVEAGSEIRVKIRK